MCVRYMLSITKRLVKGPKEALLTSRQSGSPRYLKGMALDSNQGTEFLRKKVAGLKMRLHAADKRTKKAKESYQVVEARFSRAQRLKSKLDQEIMKREAKLERTEAMIESLFGKRAALNRFRQETNHRVPVLGRGGPTLRDIDLKIATLAEQTKNIEKKHNASVDRKRGQLQQIEKAKKRFAEAETTARALQEKLAELNCRMQILEQRRLDREVLKQRLGVAQEKVARALEKAQELENTEADLETRVIELEDQIEVFKHKGKRTSAILADRDNPKSTESWTIYTLLFRRSSLLNGSMLPVKTVTYDKSDSRPNGT